MDIAYKDRTSKFIRLSDSIFLKKISIPCTTVLKSSEGFL